MRDTNFAILAYSFNFFLHFFKSEPSTTLHFAANITFAPIIISLSNSLCIFVIFLGMISSRILFESITKFTFSLFFLVSLFNIFLISYISTTYNRMLHYMSAMYNGMLHSDISSISYSFYLLSLYLLALLMFIDCQTPKTNLPRYHRHQYECVCDHASVWVHPCHGITEFFKKFFKCLEFYLCVIPKTISPLSNYFYS